MKNIKKLTFRSPADIPNEEVGDNATAAALTPREELSGRTRTPAPAAPELESPLLNPKPEDSYIWRIDLRELRIARRELSMTIYGSEEGP